MWPTEAFGGVSDEQFWDDMASDKPLATTARSAAPADRGSRRRLPDVAAPPAGRDPNGRDVDDRGRLEASRMAGGGSGTYPSPAGRPGLADRPGPADRTASQPIQTGPQRIQAGTQPVPVATRPYQPGGQPYQGPAPSYQPATQPAPVMGQGTRGGMPAEPRGRARHANGNDSGTGAIAAEDPLTSAAYAQRPPGAVDGRSYSPRRSRDRDRDLTRDQYELAVGQDTQSFTLSDTQAATGGYPGGVPPFRQYELPASGNGNGYRPDGGRSDTSRYDGNRSDPYRAGGRPDPLRSAGTADPYGASNGHPYSERPYGDQAQSVSTPPYGETYGYGYPVSPADDPRQPNGTRGTSGQGRPGANGSVSSNGTGAYPTYPAYPAANGHRGSYDPRANGRG